MSNSEVRYAPRATGRFAFLVTAAADVRIAIFDGVGEPAGAGTPPLRLELPAGFYLVRSESAGQIDEVVVRHVAPGPTIVAAPLSPRFTPAPLVGAATSYEYYTRASVQWSQNDTCEMRVGAGHAGDSRIVIFLRAVRAGLETAEGLTDGLSLIDLSGKVLWDFRSRPGWARFDDEMGWVAFSAPAAPGVYLIRFEGALAREAPIHLYPDWETQVFLLHRGRPLFEAMKVFMTRIRAGFRPDDPATRWIDDAQRALHNQEGPPAGGNVDGLSPQKLDNPLLGLLHVHFLLREARPDAGRIRSSLERLDELLPDSPDVRALGILESRRLRRAIPGLTPFTWPPMLLAGLRAVVDASVNRPGLIASGSGFDRASSRLYADSPWASWKPLSQSWDATTVPEREEKWVLGAVDSLVGLLLAVDEIPPAPSDVAARLGILVQTAERVMAKFDRSAQSARAVVSASKPFQAFVLQHCRRAYRAVESLFDEFGWRLEPAVMGGLDMPTWPPTGIHATLLEPRGRVSWQLTRQVGSGKTLATRVVVPDAEPPEGMVLLSRGDRDRPTVAVNCEAFAGWSHPGGHVLAYVVEAGTDWRDDHGRELILLRTSLEPTAELWEGGPANLIREGFLAQGWQYAIDRGFTEEELLALQALIWPRMRMLLEEIEVQDSSDLENDLARLLSILDARQQGLRERVSQLLGP
jgi:hypothetical protein